MKKVNKHDTKLLVFNLFDEHGVVQRHMATELVVSDGYVSQVLNPNNEIDGFVFSYLRFMGYLVDTHPLVFNEIDTYVQTTFDGWRVPVLSKAHNMEHFILDVNTLTKELVDAHLRRKSEAEIKVIAARLSGVLAEFQRSTRWQPEAVNS